MSCGSGSGALAEDVAAEIAARDLVAVGLISSNRNFDGRLNASVRGTFLASPPLVVAYTIAGSILHDLTRDASGRWRRTGSRCSSPICGRATPKSAPRSMPR